MTSIIKQVVVEDLNGKIFNKSGVIHIFNVT